jgi:hypothetical protein
MREQVDIRGNGDGGGTESKREQGADDRWVQWGTGQEGGTKNNPTSMQGMWVLESIIFPIFVYDCDGWIQVLNFTLIIIR